MKKIISLLMSVAIVIGMIPAMASATTTTGWDGAAATAYAGGTGIAGDPYLISNAAQLKLAQQQINSGDAEDAHFKLIADIDYENNDWVPIGNYNYTTGEGYKFAGTFDGGRHVVKNLKIEQFGVASTDLIYQQMGFFGHIFAGTVKNLGIDNMQITFNNHDYNGYRASYVGGFAGSIKGTIENCYIINSSIRNLRRGTTEYGVAAFAGELDYYTTLKNCYAYNVTVCSGYGNPQAGFVASIRCDDPVTIENCYAAEITLGSSEASNPDTISTTYGFGYNKRGTAKLTVKNCYTTVSDVVGNGTFTYNSSKTMIAEPSDKAEIIKKLVTEDADTVYTYDPTGVMNGGYPYIEYVFDGTPAIEYAGGLGTEGKPYLISNAAQLKLAQQQINSGVAEDAHFKLTADIDFANNDWEPIGKTTTGYQFAGTFDGDGHVVKNLKIEQLGTASTDFIYERPGFFGCIYGGTVKNLGIDNIQIKIKNHDYTDTAAGRTYRAQKLGGFVSWARGTIENCYIINSSVCNLNRGITEYGVGAFAGELDWLTTVKNCYAYNVTLCSGTGTASYQAGFVAGFRSSDPVTIENCYAAEIKLISSDAPSPETISTTYGFGYISRDDANVTVTNSYTTVSDVTGSGSYNSNRTMLTGAVDKAEIIKKLVTEDADTVYTYDSTGATNGGYPYIASDDEPVVTDTGLYVPDTALNIQPVVVYDAGEDAVAVATANKRPSNVIVYVDENLNANTKDGKKIDTLDNYIAKTNDKSLALLYISDSADAAALKTWFAGNEVRDITVMVEAENTALLTGIADTYKGVRGAIRYNLEDLDADSNGVLSVSERRTAVKNNNANHAKIVVLDEALSTTENVRWIQEHGTSVWSECSSDAVSLHNMIAVAPDGYITTAPAEFIDFVETYYAGATMIVNHPVAVTGHRGDCGDTTENSLSAFLHAWQNGATSVELDVYFTKDGKLAVSHDATTERIFNKTLTVSESNWADLKALTYKSPVNLEPWDTRMVTLDEVYLFLSGRGDEIEGIDIPEEYLVDTGIEICVEIKSGSTELCDKVKEVTEQYDMEDRIYFTTFYPGATSRIQEIWPEMRRGLIYDKDIGDFSIDSIAQYAWTYNSDVCIANQASYDKMVTAVRGLQMRGYPVSTYTATSNADTYNFVEMGMNYYTTDVTSRSKVHAYSVSQADVILDENGKATLAPQIVLRENMYSGETETNPAYAVFTISDTGAMTEVTANSDGTYTLPEGFATIRYAGKFANGTDYYTYATPFNVYAKNAYVINGVTVTDNKVTGVTLTEKRDEDATVIVAVFSGNRFKDMRTATAANGLVTVPEVAVSSGDEIRVFVWNSLLSLAPLAEVYTTPVQ